VYSELFALTVVVLDRVKYLLFAVSSIVYDVGLYCYNVLCNGYVGSLSLLNIYQVGNGVRSTILYYCI